MFLYVFNLMCVCLCLCLCVCVCVCVGVCVCVCVCVVCVGGVSVCVCWCVCVWCMFVFYYIDDLTCLGILYQIEGGICRLYLGLSIMGCMFCLERKIPKQFHTVKEQTLHPKPASVSPFFHLGILINTLI